MILHISQLEPGITSCKNMSLQINLLARTYHLVKMHSVRGERPSEHQDLKYGKKVNSNVELHTDFVLPLDEAMVHDPEVSNSDAPSSWLTRSCLGWRSAPGHCHWCQIPCRKAKGDTDVHRVSIANEDTETPVALPRHEQALNCSPSATAKISMIKKKASCRHSKTHQKRWHPTRSKYGQALPNTLVGKTKTATAFQPTNPIAHIKSVRDATL